MKLNDLLGNIRKAAFDLRYGKELISPLQPDEYEQQGWRRMFGSGQRNYSQPETGRSISVIGNSTPQQPTVNQVQAQGVAQEPQTIQGLTMDQLLEGYGRYGATPSAQAVQQMVDAQSKYPVFQKNPALLPALSIIETSAGRNMTRPRGDNPQNLMNWGIYTDFVPRDQAHSVERAASGIGERMEPYARFRETNNLQDFTDRYAPASDGNEGYMDKLLKAMQYFEQ